MTKTGYMPKSLMLLLFLDLNISQILSIYSKKNPLGIFVDILVRTPRFCNFNGAMMNSLSSESWHVVSEIIWLGRCCLSNKSALVGLPESWLVSSGPADRFADPQNFGSRWAVAFLVCLFSVLFFHLSHLFLSQTAAFDVPGESRKFGGSERPNANAQCPEPNKYC